MFTQVDLYFKKLSQFVCLHEKYYSYWLHRHKHKIILEAKIETSSKVIYSLWCSRLFLLLQDTVKNPQPTKQTNNSAKNTNKKPSKQANTTPPSTPLHQNPTSIDFFRSEIWKNYVLAIDWMANLQLHWKTNCADIAKFKFRSGVKERQHSSKVSELKVHHHWEKPRDSFNPPPLTAEFPRFL